MKCKIFTVAALVTLAAALYGQTRSITATKAYVDRKYVEAMNAVPSIVTNEVEEFTEWRWSCDDPVFIALNQDWIPTFKVIEITTDLIRWEPVGFEAPPPYEYESRNEAASGLLDTTNLTWHAYNKLDGGDVVTVYFTRERIVRNALGLAMLSDLKEAGVPASTVTNIARDVVNSVWDAKLGVAWEARMYDGHLYYIAVTNAPGGAQ